jgi:hypothetical protein
VSYWTLLTSRIRSAEWEEHSTDPLHPYALLGYGDKQETYDWLRKTFHWQPVFDWDYSMRPDLNATNPKNNQGYDVAAATWYKTFKKALKRTGNKIPRSEHGLAPDPWKRL